MVRQIPRRGESLAGVSGATGEGGDAHRLHEGVLPADDRQFTDPARATRSWPRASTSATCTGTTPRGRDDRPGLKACLAELREGDTLVVWKLDRLGRSLPHLLGIVDDLRERRVAFRSLTERMDTASPQGSCCSPCSARWRSTSAP